MLRPEAAGIARTKTEPTSNTLPTPNLPATPALEPNSVTAQALYHVWSGAPLVVVNSPPGAGKTTLMTTVISHLVQRSSIDTCAATVTRRQSYDLAHRLVDVMPREKIYVNISSASAEDVPEGVPYGKVNRLPDHSVRLRTLKSAEMSKDKYDLMMIDEAYQASFAGFTRAARNSEQVLMVGDPGQIGPVHTSNVSLWAGRKMAPHLPAPEIVTQYDNVIVLNLDTSYRLGNASVEAIAPLYGFEFSSGRPDRSISGQSEITSITVPKATAPYDPALMSVAVERVHELLTQRYSEGGTERAMEEQDIAVVAARNDQVSILTGMLSGFGLDKVTVGTADKMQGGQWKAVVAIDPLCGASGPSTHTESLGRLCVMASRHMAHLTWIHDGKWMKSEALSADEKETTVKGRIVREALCSHA